MRRSSTAAAAAVATAAATPTPPQQPRLQNTVGRPDSGAADDTEGAGRMRSSAAAAGTMGRRNSILESPAAGDFPVRRETRDQNTAEETSLEAEEAVMKKKRMNSGGARGSELS